MKSVITLTEAELRQAVLEYIENNTRHLEDVEHSTVSVVFRRPGPGATEALVEYNEEMPL